MRATLAAVLLVLVFAGPALAKRRAPATVPAVSHGGVRYEAPHFRDGKPQNGGYVVAWQAREKRVLWEVQVYRTAYQKDLERDVQDVFITSLRLTPRKDALLIANQRKECFRLELQSRAVKSVACGLAR